MKEIIKAALWEFFTELGHDVIVAFIGTSYRVALLGGTICIILYIGGWEKGLRWAGILFVGHILIRGVLG